MLQIKVKNNKNETVYILQEFNRNVFVFLTRTLPCFFLSSYFCCQQTVFFQDRVILTKRCCCVVSELTQRLPECRNLQTELLILEASVTRAVLEIFPDTVFQEFFVCALALGSTFPANTGHKHTTIEVSGITLTTCVFVLFRLAFLNKCAATLHFRLRIFASQESLSCCYTLVITVTIALAERFLYSFVSAQDPFEFPAASLAAHFVVFEVAATLV